MCSGIFGAFSFGGCGYFSSVNLLFGTVINLSYLAAMVLWLSFWLQRLNDGMRVRNGHVRIFLCNDVFGIVDVVMG